MRKKIFILVLISFFVNVNYVNGDASASISVSNSNTIVGNSGSATLTVDGNGGHIGQVYGTFSCEGLGSKDLKFSVSDSAPTSKTYKINWTAKKSGTYTCSVSGLEVGILEHPDWGLKSVSVSSKVITVIGSNNANKYNSTNNGNSTANNNDTINEKKNYSSDNTLTSLSVDGYDISPEFKKDVTEYKLSVDYNVEKVNIKAKTSDDKASINGIGEVNLSDGENIINVKVVAENGNEKIYKINIIVEDKNPINVTVGKKKYIVIKKNNNIIDKLDGYEEKTIKIDNQDVISYYNSSNGLTLVLLKDSDGKVNYYIYDNDKYSLYKEVKFNIFKLLILDMPKDKVIDGYKKFSFELDGSKYDGYKLSKNSDFYLIYALDLGSGNKDLYLYDSKVNNCIRYDNKIAEYYANKYKKNIRNYHMGCFILTVFILVAIIIKVIKSITYKNVGKKRKKKVI